MIGGVGSDDSTRPVRSHSPPRLSSSSSSSRGLARDGRRLRSGRHGTLGGAVIFRRGAAAGDDLTSPLMDHGSSPGLRHILVLLMVELRFGFALSIDQTHLHSGERFFEVPVAGIEVSGRPTTSSPQPQRRLPRSPDVHHCGGAEGLESHRLQGPTLPARIIRSAPRRFCLAPSFSMKQPACRRGSRCRAKLFRCEPPPPGTGAAAAVARTVCACAVPGHANEAAPQLARVCRPPVLRVGHQRPAGPSSPPPGRGSRTLWRSRSSPPIGMLSGSADAGS